VKHTFTTAYVKDGGQTRAVVGDGKPVAEHVMVEETGVWEAGLNSSQWPEEEERKLVAELRRQWIETSEQLRQEGKDTVGGLRLDELGEALEAGFSREGVGEEQQGGGSRESGVGEEEEGQEPSEEEGGRQKAEGGADGAVVSANGPSSPTPDSPLPTPDSPDSPLPTPDGNPDLHEVTATAWDRVRFLEWWSRWERGEMKGILQRTGQHTEKTTTRTVLEALLRLFRGYKKILFEARHYEAKLQDALFRFLSRLYGGDPGFERPSPWWVEPELYKQMKKDMQEVWANC